MNAAVLILLAIMITSSSSLITNRLQKHGLWTIRYFAKRIAEGQIVQLKSGAVGKVISKVKPGIWEVEFSFSNNISIQNLKTSELTPVTKTNLTTIAVVTSPSIHSVPSKPNIPINLDTNTHTSIPVVDISHDTNENDAVIQTLTSPSNHASMSQWIIFSDLHVKGASIDTCEEVLRAVHQTAIDKNAGIIFLGDFWHVRGSLSVELLNRVLKALRKWKQPVIMIPGNHDQVSLGGSIHALEPLKYAFTPDQILMISEPTVCLGALWIPYRRSAAVMKSVLTQAASRTDFSMVFCHADVKGAFMNDNIQCREGLEASDFVPHIPTYTGHFHKPHTIIKKDCRVRYVGSPYQTSLSEAGQQKLLYCMSSVPLEEALDAAKIKVVKPAAIVPQKLKCANGDARNENVVIKVMERVWREVERIPIDLGKKYFKASIDDSVAIDKTRPGDKLVLSVRVGEEHMADKLLSELVGRGVEVELRHEGYRSTASRRSDSGLPKPLQMEGSIDVGGNEPLMTADSEEVTGAIAESEQSLSADTDPVTLFRAFMSSGGYDDVLANAKSDGNMSDTKSLTDSQFIADSISLIARTDLYQRVLSEGVTTIERLRSYDKNVGSGYNSSAGVKTLSISQVKITNFGPYGGESVRYPLANRGLVLITAQSTDGTGADSNGAGKTTLAMSVLWGLTGSMDARLAGDSKAADVAYDAGEGQSKRTAEVIVTGTINSKPFELVRRRGPRKSELLFSVNGTDLTTQAAKDTQAVIDDVLGIGQGLLQRCCFFGQHSHTLQSLLGLTDVRLKSELSLLVNTEIWTVALQDVRARDKEARSKVQELIIEKRVRNEELIRVDSDLISAEATNERLKQEYEKAAAKAAEEMGLHKAALSTVYGNQSIDSLKEELITNSAQTCKLQTEADCMRRDLMQATREKTGRLKLYIDRVNNLREQIAQLTATQIAKHSALSGLQSKINQMSSQLKNSIQARDNLREKILNSFSHLASQSLEEILEIARFRADSTRSELSLTDLKIVTTKTALGRVQELLKGLSKTGSTGGVDHDCKFIEGSCPTCGQDLPLNMTQQREKELKADLLELTARRNTISCEADDYRGLFDMCLKLKELSYQVTVIESRISEFDVEMKDTERESKDISKQLTSSQEILLAAVNERDLYDAHLQKEESDKAALLRSVEVALQRSRDDEIAIRAKLDEIQRVEESSRRRQASANSTVTLAEDRWRGANVTLKEKLETKQKLLSVLASIEHEQLRSKDMSIMFERLEEVLGLRGIQQYLFISVVRSIEEIANGYLTVLAAGGIQLSLQGEWDSERIIKRVLVRAADGELRERALSQLSGGQWRRVSLALDLAFAETVRRRGSLRCNLLVMDEVLTHLDASGREAVGTVLRSLVRSDNGRLNLTKSSEPANRVDVDDSEMKIFDDSIDSEIVFSSTSSLMGASQTPSSYREGIAYASRLLGGGAYDTVLVILQDLSAIEMEEAFDHIDIVSKPADYATVKIDGGS